MFHFFRAAIFDCCNHLGADGAALAFILPITLVVSRQHNPLSRNRQGCIPGKDFELALESAAEEMSEVVGVNGFTALYVLLPIDMK